MYVIITFTGQKVYLTEKKKKYGQFLNLFDIWMILLLTHWCEIPFLFNKFMQVEWSFKNEYLFSWQNLVKCSTILSLYNIPVKKKLIMKKIWSAKTWAYRTTMKGSQRKRFNVPPLSRKGKLTIRENLPASQKRIQFELRFGYWNKSWRRHENRFSH